MKNQIEQFVGKIHLILKVFHMREKISYEMLDKDFMHKQVISHEKSFSNWKLIKSKREKHNIQGKYN